MQADDVSQRREWNAGVYHRVSEPQFEWGLKVLNRLQLRGDETVLDAGCGTGRLTAELLRRLPGGRVTDEQLRYKLLDELTGLAAKDNPSFEIDYWRLNLHGTRPR